LAPRLRNFAWLVLALLAFGANAADPRYVSVKGTPDGIGKVYMGREIAKVMSYHGASWLERPERAQEERPDLVLAALDLKPGMLVADIGAGSGYYSSRMAELVGKSGMVYAVDVQQEMLDILRLRMRLQRITNVMPILGSDTDPKLPERALDLAIMVDVYHEFEYPYEMLAAIVKALKPGGRLVFVEFKAGDPKVSIKPVHTMTEAQVKKEAAVQPLEWVKTVGGLPRQHVIVFRRR